MPDDRKIAKRALDLQTRAKDYAMFELPGYSAWTKRKLAQGESPALVENLDARSMWLLPEELVDITEDEFEEMLQDLKTEIDKFEDRAS